MLVFRKILRMYLVDEPLLKYLPTFFRVISSDIVTGSVLAIFAIGLLQSSSFKVVRQIS